MTARLPGQYETQDGHRCATWRVDGAAGLVCDDDRVILPSDVEPARLRARRIPDDAPVSQVRGEARTSTAPTRALRRSSRGPSGPRNPCTTREGPRSMTETIMPEPAQVGDRAAQIMRAMQAHPGYDRLRSSSMKYSTCWATFTGYPLISKWSLDRDAEPLLTEALRVLALKAAVFELTEGDERAAELLVPAPVDEMVHAVLAQFTVMTEMQADLELTFPHATELERFDYDRGCITDAYYQAAGWGEQPSRYWLGSEEVERRLKVLNSRYEAAGLGQDGRSHGIDFDTLVAV